MTSVSVWLEASFKNKFECKVQILGPGRGQLLSQAFCSALPVSYNRHGAPHAWERFATLVLEAAYEATLLAALECPVRGGRPRVYLTLLGGGAFGNQREWILRAIRRALELHRNSELQVSLVSRDAIPADLQEIAASWN